MTAIEAWLFARRRMWLVFLCLFGGARVVWLSVATPILTNVDEPQHLDTVVQYADGRWPLGVAPSTTEVRQVMFRHASLEYFVRRDDPLNPPEAIRAMADFVRNAPLPDTYDPPPNHELAQPPVYYVLAGAIYRELRAAGVPLRVRPFLLRILNVPILVLTLLATYRLAQLVAPGRPSVVLGAPLLVAAFPQDAFHQISNDSLSAAVCGWALVWLLAPIRSGRLTWPTALAGGLATAATVLTKWSNLPILALVPIAALAGWRGARNGRGAARDESEVSSLRSARGRMPQKHSAGTTAASGRTPDDPNRQAQRSQRQTAVAVLVAAALLPPAAWSARCRIVVGDYTASGPVVTFLRWTPKPVGQWFEHPIFRPAGWNPLQLNDGLPHMLYETIATYWRGELVWRLERVRLSPLDLSYYVATLLCFAFALVAVSRGGDVWRTGLLFLWAFCALGLAELIVLSIRFDFGTCFYPSRAMPYMCSGRLILGTLAAFATVFVVGLTELVRPLSRSVGVLPVLITACLIMTAGELIAAAPVLGQRCCLWNP